MADTPGTANRWVITTEVPDANSAERYRTFNFAGATQQEHYWFATGRRFGAQKLYLPNQADPAIRFSVWAPNAQGVEVVFALMADPLNGYISNDGDGIDLTAGNQGAFPLFSRPGGIWETDVAQSPALARFDDFHERPYMFRISNEQGQVTYKTDIYSRNQAGRGRTVPGSAHF